MYCLKNITATINSSLGITDTTNKHTREHNGYPHQGYSEERWQLLPIFMNDNPVCKYFSLQDIHNTPNTVTKVLLKCLRIKTKFHIKYTS